MQERIERWKTSGYTQGCRVCFSVLKDLWDSDSMDCNGCPGYHCTYITVHFLGVEIEVFAPNEGVAEYLARADFFRRFGRPAPTILYYTRAWLTRPFREDNTMNKEEAE